MNIPTATSIRELCRGSSYLQIGGDIYAPCATDASCIYERCSRLMIAGEIMTDTAASWYNAFCECNCLMDPGREWASHEITDGRGMFMNTAIPALPLICEGDINTLVISIPYPCEGMFRDCMKLRIMMDASKYKYIFNITTDGSAANTFRNTALFYGAHRMNEISIRAQSVSDLTRFLCTSTREPYAEGFSVYSLTENAGQIFSGFGASDVVLLDLPNVRFNLLETNEWVVDYASPLYGHRQVGIDGTLQIRIPSGTYISDEMHKQCSFAPWGTIVIDNAIIRWDDIAKLQENTANIILQRVRIHPRIGGLPPARNRSSVRISIILDPTETMSPRELIDLWGDEYHSVTVT